MNNWFYRNDGFTEIGAVIVFVGTLAIIGLIIMVGCGMFAQPAGYYMKVDGVQLSSGDSYGHVYSVMQDRRPGPDRRIGAFADSGVAYALLRELNNPSRLIFPAKGND